MNSLHFLDHFHSSFSRQSPSTSVCNYYCIDYSYLCFNNCTLSDIVELLTNISRRDLCVKQYIYNKQIRHCILNLCNRTGQRVK